MADFLNRLEAGWTSIARRRTLSCVLIFVLSLLVRLTLLPIDPEPEPRIEDEFSYILGGETFAKGRLASPTPPMWRFFETVHINMLPTYVSKYPPGQALFLALGIRVFGHPWYGVVISVALMCASICWMLQRWLPPKYALLGGLLAVFQFDIAHYWVDSYWGGAVAAIGGALVFGALPGLARGGRALDACAAAVGIAILANSRPFEGGVLVLLSIIALLIWTRRNFRTWIRIPVVVPGVGFLLLTAAGMAYYNLRTTGSWQTMPYTVNQERYATTPVLWILPPYPPKRHEYRDDSMRELWETWDRDHYVQARRDPKSQIFQLDGTLHELFGDGAGLMFFLFACSLPLAGIPRLRLALAVFLLWLGTMSLLKFTQPHYLAPGLAPLFVSVMFGAWLLRCLRLNRRVSGLPLLASVLLLACAHTLLFDKYTRLRGHRNDFRSVAFRQQVSRQLNSEPGQHLVLVHYGPNHSVIEEIVYNTPDIDSQKVIWAFDFGPTEDRPLLDYYRGRRVWLLRPDPPEPTIEPYPGN